MSGSRPSASACRAGFSLIEAVLSILIVAVMFGASMAAAGVAARDRMIQNDIRRGEQLARELMAEITMQRYADPSANTIAHWSGISSVDRSNWTHLDDYFDFNESPPRNRDGSAIPGASGWRWQSVVAYQGITDFAGAGASSTAGPIGGLLQGVTGLLGAILGVTPAPADTGLKQIVVTVTAPTGKATILTAMRSSGGAVDRISTAPGFRTGTILTLTIGPDRRTVTTGSPMLNTPAIP
jgi:hypothetical protein